MGMFKFLIIFPIFLALGAFAAVNGWLIVAFSLFMVSAICAAIPVVFHETPKAPITSWGFDEPQTIVHRHEHHHHNYNDITEGTEISQEMPDGRMITTRHIKRWN